jgi:hypothetical protein
MTINLPTKISIDSTWDWKSVFIMPLFAFEINTGEIDIGIGWLFWHTDITLERNKS